MCSGHVERVTGHLTVDVLHLKARRVMSGHKNTAWRRFIPYKRFRRSNKNRFAIGMVFSGALPYQSLLNRLGNRLANLGRCRLAADVWRAWAVN